MDRTKPAYGRRVDVDDVTLVWGNRTTWKASLREESARKHRDKPIGERLRAALAMVLSRTRP